MRENAVPLAAAAAAAATAAVIEEENNHFIDQIGDIEFNNYG